MFISATLVIPLLKLGLKMCQTWEITWYKDDHRPQAKVTELEWVVRGPINAGDSFFSIVNVSCEKLYDHLDSIFGFDDFDPAPINNCIEDFNGLAVPWANTTFCNPPYSLCLRARSYFTK